MRASCTKCSFADWALKRGESATWHLSWQRQARNECKETSGRKSTIALLSQLCSPDLSRLIKRYAGMLPCDSGVLCSTEIVVCSLLGNFSNALSPSCAQGCFPCKLKAATGKPAARADRDPRMGAGRQGHPVLQKAVHLSTTSCERLLHERIRRGLVP